MNAQSEDTGCSQCCVINQKQIAAENYYERLPNHAIDFDGIRENHLKLLDSMAPIRIRSLFWTAHGCLNLIISVKTAKA
jgi:hypothetical protein